MKAQIIDGAGISKQIREEIKNQVIEFKNNHNRAPGLAVILIGTDSSSKIYVNNKIKACEEVGIKSFAYEIEDGKSETDIINIIKILNNDRNVDGILLQSPLPSGYDELKISSYISDDKDVDGFSYENVGRLVIGNPRFVACTPLAVMELLKRYNIKTEGKEVVIIGRSNIVGKPLFNLMLAANATVTVCHSKTKNLKKVAKRADILVAAVGKPLFVTADMVKKDAVVIDVGINRNTENKVVGDVDFNNVCEIASYITPVPKGVGPMTITMLLHNTLMSANEKYQ
jgi:methylenetetrahydrofolate dehydrogenase (NADP+)/methenyltetrahydrofolate cyclohydrolase